MLNSDTLITQHIQFFFIEGLCSLLIAIYPKTIITKATFLKLKGRKMLKGGSFEQKV